MESDDRDNADAQDRQQVKTLESEILRLRFTRQRDQLKHEHLIRDHTRHILNLDARIQHYLAHYKRKIKAVHHYESYLYPDNTEQPLPVFFTLEAKLLRDVHHMGILDKQLVLVKRQSKKLIRQFQNELAEQSQLFTDARHEQARKALELEILRLRFTRHRDQLAHEQLIRDHARHILNLDSRIQHYFAHYKQKVEALHHYESYLYPDNTLQPPPVILSLEAKVLRDVHHMDILDKQLALAKRQSKKLIRQFQKELAEQTQTKTVVEQDLLDQMVKLQKAEQYMHESFRITQEQQIQEIDELRHVVFYSSLHFEPLEVAPSFTNDLPAPQLEHQQSPHEDMDVLLEQMVAMGLDENSEDTRCHHKPTASSACSSAASTAPSSPETVRPSLSSYSYWKSQRDELLSL